MNTHIRHKAKGYITFWYLPSCSNRNEPGLYPWSSENFLSPMSFSSQLAPTLSSSALQSHLIILESPPAPSSVLHDNCLPPDDDSFSPIFIIALHFCGFFMWSGSTCWWSGSTCWNLDQHVGNCHPWRQIMLHNYRYFRIVVSHQVWEFWSQTLRAHRIDCICRIETFELSLIHSPGIPAEINSQAVQHFSFKNFHFSWITFERIVFSTAVLATEKIN